MRVADSTVINACVLSNTSKTLPTGLFRSGCRVPRGVGPFAPTSDTFRFRTIPLFIGYGVSEGSTNNAAPDRLAQSMAFCRLAVLVAGSFSGNTPHSRILLKGPSIILKRISIETYSTERKLKKQ